MKKSMIALAVLLLFSSFLLTDSFAAGGAGGGAGGAAGSAGGSSSGSMSGSTGTTGTGQAGMNAGQGNTLPYSPERTAPSDMTPGTSQQSGASHNQGGGY